MPGPLPPAEFAALCARAATEPSCDVIRARADARWRAWYAEHEPEILAVCAEDQRRAEVLRVACERDAERLGVRAR